MTQPKTDTTTLLDEMATEKVRLEMRLESYRYLNAYGVSLEDAIARETDRLSTMKKLHAVNAAIDEWMRTPMTTMRSMTDGDLYA